MAIRYQYFKTELRYAEQKLYNPAKNGRHPKIVKRLVEAHMDFGNYFSWLHISDFHAGMKGSNNKWGQVKEKFHRDVTQHIEKNGALDLVIFSGDLTQQGKPDEYANVIGELTELWEKFTETNASPKLLVIPGNHDLNRPGAGEPILVAAEDFSRDGLEHQIFNNPKSLYLQNLKDCFSGYLQFIETLKQTSIPLALTHDGKLPGEGSGVLHKGDRKIGLVGLNSAWSHLKVGDLKRAIHISSEQLHGAVPTAIDPWTKQNDANLLVTHHPIDWLTEQSSKTFINEINPLGRFSAHLFGHMHESITKLEDFGQGTPKISLQAASLFGLEKYGKGLEERRHGYYFAQLNFETDKLKVWPRRAETVNGAGGWRIRPETGSLPEDQHECGEVTFPTNAAKKKTKQEIKPVQPASGHLTATRVSSTLKIASIRHALPKFQEHLPLAFSPKTVFDSLARLKSEKFICICAPWDSYSDEFLTVLDQSLTSQQDWIRINFNTYVDMRTFHSDIDGNGLISYDEITNHLQQTDETILLIDNVSHERSKSGRTFLDEALSISKDLLKSHSNLKIVIRTRSSPQYSPTITESLGALDEPNTNRFLLKHPLRRNITEASLAAGEVYRMSGGNPGSLDRILQKLSYTKLTELATECSTMATQNIDIQQINPDLISKISTLDNSESERLYDLLSTFCVFPFGEDITHIRNLKRKQPYYPMQSAQLVSMGLLNTIEHDFFDREGAELPKVVTSSFSANEYLRALHPEKFRELTQQALITYFGQDWAQGDYKLGPSFSEEKLQNFEYSTLNAIGLLRRLFKDATLSGEDRAIQDALGVINFYTSKLDQKCRYREICGLCIILIPLIKNNIDWNSAQDILFRLGNALRMLKEHTEALNIFAYLLELKKDSRNFNARLHLHMAMSYEEQNDESNSIKHAKLASETSSKNSTYYHAKSMIVSKSKAKNVKNRLSAIQRKCASDSYHIVANNIDIKISNRFDSPSELRETYKRIANKALSQNDIYNFVKSCTRYVDLTLKAGETVSKQMTNSLKACFDYARSQRLEDFFRSSMKSLWTIIEKNGDLYLLGKLTALSSKTLRLLHDEHTEKEYITKLLQANGLTPLILSADHLHYLEDRVRQLGIKPLNSVELS